MSSDLRTLVLAAMLTGCVVDDAPLIDIEATAKSPVTFGPASTEPLTKEQATYRWDLVRAPDGSIAEPPVGDETAMFLPDIRGTYVVERWLSYGLAETLTHRFVLHVAGIAPGAFIRGSSQVAVGDTATLDGSESSSVEGRELQFRWRLAERPRDSVATLSVTDAPMTTFVPDMAGSYVVELATFDGELWSARVPIQVTAH
ncbi:MAG: hypothetical protein HOV81_04510 [Kofleriaceae bacterium]|nr:hypothetical protein [Kofleriaceae bacterium]